MKKALRRIITNTLGGCALGSSFIALTYISEKRAGYDTGRPRDWFELAGICGGICAAGAGASSAIAEIGRFDRWTPGMRP